MARFRLELGPVPLHHQVYLDLSAALDADEWRPGDRLPPERELAERYGCSLITVRRALSELAREQRLRADARTRARSCSGRDSTSTSAATRASRARCRAAGSTPRPGSSRPARRRPSEVVANALGLEVGSPTLYLERLRLAGGEPLLLEQVHLPAERFPGLLASDLEHSPCTTLLTERYGTRVVRAREALEPVLLRGREAELPRPGRRRGRRCSSRASPSPPTASRSSSPGPTSAATEPATTSNGSSSAPRRRARPATEPVGERRSVRGAVAETAG